MKKLIILCLFLLQIIPYINKNGDFVVGCSEMMAQNTSGEQVCEDEYGSFAIYSGSCDGACVTTCSMGHESYPCDSYTGCSYCSSGNNNDKDKKNPRIDDIDIPIPDGSGGSGGAVGPGGGGGKMGGDEDKKYDCANVLNGSAYMDPCGWCVGGTTGKNPCVKDCNGVANGTAYKDDCDKCVGGTTNETPCEQSFCNPLSKAYNPTMCTKQCNAIKTLWNNSFLNNKKKETGAFILIDGSYYIFDNKNNGSYNVSWPGVKIVDHVAFVQLPDGNYKAIIGMIHTHTDSNPSLHQGPTIYDDGSKDDFTPLEQIGGRWFGEQISGYVVATNKIYKYYFDNNGNKVVETIGTRDNLSECP